MNDISDKMLCVAIEATCWEKPKDQPPGQKNEIIEIGVVPISLRTLEIGEPVGILVKPTVSKVSEFCTKITTLTQEQVDTGIIFKDACAKLIKELDSQKTPWISWGDFDKKQFLWQCEDFKCSYPFGAGSWDLSGTFAKLMGLKKEVGISQALELMGMKFEGTRHRGLDEAKNIATVAVNIFGKIRELIVKEEK